MEKFYRKKMPWNPDDALEIVNASLDPLNQQSKYAEAILILFRDRITNDKEYVKCPAWHNDTFRQAIAKRARC